MGETASYGVKNIQGSNHSQSEKNPTNQFDPQMAPELEAGELITDIPE
jgi:hypothetical protein